jgi:RNA polymerase sporulation-specific sigma factor
MIGSVKVSRSIKELAIKIKDIQNKYLKEKGREISISEIEKELKVGKEEITLAMDSIKPTISIYEDSYSDEKGGISFLDKLSTNVDEQEQLANKLTIKSLIENLEEREREIILLRYYKNKTQMQVAKILGISQVQVSRIEKKILNSMKQKIS